MRRVILILLLVFIFAFSANILFAQQAIQEKIFTQQAVQEKQKEEQFKRERMLELERAFQELKQKEEMLRHELEAMRYKERVELTPELEEKLLHEVAETNEERAILLERLKSENPRNYEKVMLEYALQYQNLEKIKEKDPKRYEEIKRKRDLEEKSHQIARQYKMTEDKNEQKNHEQELRAVLNELFELRELDRQMEIEKLSERLDELKDVMNMRKKNKKEIVENRLKELLGEIKKLTW